MMRRVAILPNGAGFYMCTGRILPGYERNVHTIETLLGRNRGDRDPVDSSDADAGARVA